MKKSKKSSKMASFIGFIGALFGIAAVCMGFMNFVTLTGKLLGKTGELATMTGFVGAFGSKAGDSTPAWATLADGSSDGKLTISMKVGILILFILLAAGALLAILGAISKGKVGKFLLALGGLAMIAGAIMAFFSVQLCSFKSVGDASLGYTYSLGIGAILAGVFGGVGGLLSTGAGVVSLVK